MFNVCPRCGIYAADKRIDPAGPFAICPACGYAHPFQRLPLFVVSGASGAGKTATCLALTGRLPECVVLEMDILWRPEFDTPADGYHAFRDAWLRLAKNIGQSGRPVVLCGSATPEKFEEHPERRYVAAIHYLALICDDATLAARLQARPGWRQADAPAFVARMLAFNRWLREHADQTQPPMALFDTSTGTVDDSAAFAARWVRDLLPTGIA